MIIPGCLYFYIKDMSNTAGVYYLEGLSQGEYTLLVNGKSMQTIKLDADSPPFQELELQQPF